MSISLRPGGIWNAVSASMRKTLPLGLCILLQVQCGGSKDAKKGEKLAVRSVTHRGPIWVVKKNPQGQKFVQTQEPVWNMTGTPAKSEPLPGEVTSAPPSK